jgi:hypothetical protein
VNRYFQIVAAVIAAWPGVTQAWCVLESPNIWSPSTTSIPVHLNNNMSAICSGPDGDCSGIGDVARVTQVVLDEFFDDAGAAIRFSYAGTTSNSPGSNISGAIHVYLIGGCDSETRGIAHRVPDGSYIGACRLEICDQWTWRSMPVSTSGATESFTNTLGHELMHCLGFAHPQDCGQTQASRVKPQVKAHHLYKDDIQGLQTRYGVRAHTPRLRYGVDGLNWTTGSDGTALTKMPLGRISISNSARLLSYISFPQKDNVSPRRIYVGRPVNSGDWVNLGIVPNSDTHYHTGTASGGWQQILVAWLHYVSNELGLKEVRVSQTTDNGTNWSTTVVSITDTERSGVTATYDPVSQRYIALWRSSEERIIVRVLPDGQPQQFAWRASDTPGIACGTTTFAGTKNCVVAWAHTDWDRFLYWAHARVDTSGSTPALVLLNSDVYARATVVYSQASVAFVPHSSFPWSITYQNQPSRIHTMRKASSTSADWVDTASVQYLFSRVGSPTVGSYAPFGGDPVRQQLHFR